MLCSGLGGFRHSYVSLVGNVRLRRDRGEKVSWWRAKSGRMGRVGVGRGLGRLMKRGGIEGGDKGFLLLEEKGRERMEKWMDAGPFTSSSSWWSRGVV
jgi:hypothetical protein